MRVQRVVSGGIAQVYLMFTEHEIDTTDSAILLQVEFLLKALGTQAANGQLQFFAITSIVLVRMLIQQLLQDRFWLKFTVLMDVVSQEQVVLRSVIRFAA